MPLPRIYRLRGDDTRVVLHKELAVFLGFTGNPLREPRHELEMCLRPHLEADPFPGGARFVLKNQEFREFNKEVFADYGERLKGKQATLYTSIGVKFIMDLLSEKAVRAAGAQDKELIGILANRGIPLPRPIGITPPLPFTVPPPSTGPVTTPSSTLPTGLVPTLSLLTFDGDALETTVVEGEPYVSLPSLCRPFGKDVSNQRVRWARTVLGTVRDASGRVQSNVTLLHAQDVPMFVARLNPRGMTPGLKVKHDQYVRHCAIVLADHFKLLREPAAATIATPPPATAVPATPAPQAIAPVATLSAIMLALSGWVKDGKLSADVADRYVVDWIQRNGVLDFTTEPPPLPEVFLIKGTAHQPPKTNGNGTTSIPPFKQGLRGPFSTAAIILVEIDKRTGGQGRSVLKINGTDEVVALAKELGVHEHSYWGRWQNAVWEYDVDATRKIHELVDTRLRDFNQGRHATA